MLPESLLRYRRRDGVVEPLFLTACDYPELRALLDAHRRFTGRPERELKDHLQAVGGDRGAPSARALASRVLTRLSRGRARPTRLPARLREEVFLLAASGHQAPLGEAASRLGVAIGEVDALLFADLRGERLVPPPPAELGPQQLALETNLLLAQGLVSRAESLTLDLRGRVRSVLRQSRLVGLLATVRPLAGEAVQLEVTGPLSLFRHTPIYGRAIASLIPLLPWCDSYRLLARCRLRGESSALLLASGDPLPAGAEPRRFDSAVERRFAADFVRAGSGFDLVREPEPVAAGGTLIFPDFAIVDRRQGGRRWWLEIAGFWTPEYIARKLERLAAARLPNLILCIDARRNCAEADLPEPAAVLRYERWIDVAAVLRLIG